MFKILLLFSILGLFDQGCKSNEVSMVHNSSGDQIDCYNDRQTVEKLDREAAIIAFVANTFILTAKEGTKRYQPCILPDSLQKEGISVIFSGEVKEIFPYERRFATPLFLTTIRKQ